MRRKLLPFLIHWMRPSNKKPPSGMQVVVRLRDPAALFAVLHFDSKDGLWHVPNHIKGNHSDGYEDYEIFAWSYLPNEPWTSFFERSHERGSLLKKNRRGILR